MRVCVPAEPLDVVFTTSTTVGTGVGARIGAVVGAGVVGAGIGAVVGAGIGAVVGAVVPVLFSSPRKGQAVSSSQLVGPSVHPPAGPAGRPGGWHLVN